MRRWSIKGFTSANRINFFGDVTPDTLADPERRLEGIDTTDRKGEPLDPSYVAKAGLSATTQEPYRALIEFHDDDGKRYHRWIYLKDFATTWADVEWNDVLEALAAQYFVDATPPPPPPLPKPKPKPAPRPRKKIPLIKRAWAGIRKWFGRK